ncbi:hypothetical protein ACFW0H_01190 [Pseudomonas sp. CR3202]|uniref:hypothetical protein n=1 Tax=Pseudomonas sp. CR3202 TaxID=3351532 RepID=UPI003BF054FE
MPQQDGTHDPEHHAGLPPLSPPVPEESRHARQRLKWCRIFASQTLGSSASPERIVQQLGHSSTAIAFKHYVKLIIKDGPDIVGKPNNIPDR